MSTWKRATTPPPIRSADPRDSERPHRDPPSKRDMNQVMLAVCRKALDEAIARRNHERNQRRQATAQEEPS
jgi:hypothetical protein